MKLLLLGNKAAHYRATIYQLIDKTFDCDFYFGDSIGANKRMDYSLLSGKVTEVHCLSLPKIEYQKGVIRLLREDYDTYIVYSGIRCISSWFFLIIRKLFYPRKRVFAWTHGLLGKEGRGKRWLYKFMFSMLNGGFIYNERSTRLMIDDGIPGSKLHTIYNSLDYDAQFKIRQALRQTNIYPNHFHNSNHNIVFIGRLTAVKRFDLLLDAVRILKNRGEIVNVTFIGDGVERGFMEQRVDFLGIRDQIWFYGACYDEITNAELIFNADLCVSPGNIGLTAIHVHMFGCPIVTNNDFNHQMPEFEVIQEGKTGTFFMAGNSRSLADTISEWFDTHLSDRDDIRSNCYHVIDEKWNPHNQIRILKDVLLKNFE